MMIKWLFFDYQELEVVRGFTRRLNPPQKHPGNPFFVADFPWQRGDMQLYGSVIRASDGVFRAWYQAHTRSERRLLHYAESDDGIRWRHPTFDVVEEGGERTSGVFLHSHGSAVLYDPADAREEWRYKLVTGAPPSGCISGFHSADGIHWVAVSRGPIIPSNPDCPIGFCRAVDGRYVIYHRIWGYGRRVFRSESWDFLHWSSEPRLVLEPDAQDDPQMQFYGLGAVPYGHYEVGTLWTYRTDAGDRNVHKMFGAQETELAYARSGYAWHRAAQNVPFIPRGAGDAWDHANLHCGSSPVFLAEEIRYYFAGTQGRHGSGGWKDIPQPAGLGMATLRPDGFVSLTAGEGPGELVTAAFKLPHTRMLVNATIEPGGWVRAGLITMEEGEPVPGFGLDDCAPLTGDSTTHEVQWRMPEAGQAADPSGKWVLLQLRAQRASVYSIAIARPGEEAAYHLFSEANPGRNHVPAPRASLPA
jgi:hypothetical protein